MALESEKKDWFKWVVLEIYVLESSHQNEMKNNGSNKNCIKHGTDPR